MTTVHAYTGDQSLVDGPHKDLRRGKAAAFNIVPTTTGAAKAINSIIPGLAGKLNGFAVRVPTPDGSLTIFTASLKKETTAEEVNNEFKKAANSELKKILEYSEEPLVSTDIIGNSYSSIFDSKLTDVKENMVRVVSWYDNEYGYSCRMINMIKHIVK